MELLEIILFASIAAFFALRLYSVLGRRSSDEPTAAPQPAGASQPPPIVEPAVFTGPAAAGLEAIRAADRSFGPDGFLDGARRAYEIIVSAYAAGDRAALRPLLSPSVYERYDAAITQREAAGHKQVSDLVKLEKSEIEAASWTDGVAEVGVRFTAEIASGLVDSDGVVVEGDPTRIRRVEEIWTFERETRSSDPTWRLVKVRKG